MGFRFDELVFTKLLRKYGCEGEQPVSLFMFLKAHGFNPDGTPVAPKGPQSTGLVTESGEHKGKDAVHPPWTPEQVNNALGKKMQTQFKSVAKAFRSADENKNGTLDKVQ